MTGPTVEEQQRFNICSLALLHKMARAAGGTLTIRLDDIPENLPFNFRVTNGVAIFTALERPVSTIVTASERVLGKLGPAPGANKR